MPAINVSIHDLQGCLDTRVTYIICHLILESDILGFEEFLQRLLFLTIQ